MRLRVGEQEAPCKKRALNGYILQGLDALHNRAKLCRDVTQQKMYSEQRQCAVHTTEVYLPMLFNLFLARAASWVEGCSLITLYKYSLAFALFLSFK
jgi:hypothetical protein